MPGYVPIGSSIMIGDTRSISIYDGSEWEVTLDSIEFTDGSLSTGYYYLTPDDGFTYLIATLTVRNTGMKGADFYTSGSTVIYDGKYEYNKESALSDDFTGLAPLSNPRTGVITFMVPKSVAESNDALVINIADVSYVIRPGDDTSSGIGTNGDASEIGNVYEGSWAGRDYDRIFMEINYVDANGGYFDISISWSSSASEVSEWELWGVYMEEEGVIQYYGNQIESCYYDDGGVNSEVVSETEEGILWIGDDGLLYWDDYTESSGESYALEKLAY